MKAIIIAVVLLIVCNLQAQNFKFGKVSKEELAEKVHPKDPTANAALLFKRESVRFDYRKGDGFTQVRTIHQRIKIYNKEGFSWATKKVRLYDKMNSESEKLYKLKAYTYNLVDGKVKDDKLKSDGVFDEELNKFWKVKSFTMPNIKEGCIVEFTYEISSPFLAIDDLELQYTIPINVLEVLVKTPEYFIYNKVLNPQTTYLPKIEESSSTKSESITNTSISNGSLGSRNSDTSVSQFTINENVIKVNETDIPALKDEPFVDNLGNYQAKLKLELTAIKYPNEPYKNLSSSWDAVTKTIYKSDDFGEQLDRSGYYEDEIDALTANLESNAQKAFAIYNYVKVKVKWNGFYGYSTDAGVRKAYKEGVGNVGDINLMLVSMLRYAGIIANPVLISTKSHGIPLFPTRDGFNYVICFVEDEDIMSLLDATGDNATFNTLPIRDLNWQGRVIRENGSSTWIDLTPRKVSRDITGLNIKINSDLSAEGKVRSQKFDYIAKSYRDNYADLSTEAYIKVLEKDKGEVLISNLEVEGEDSLLEPIKITYEYTMDNALEEIGDKLYFSPLLFLNTQENPFKQDERKLPIDLMYPMSDKYMINIMLPEGYDVEYLPENQALDFANKTGEFKYLVNQNGRFLQVNVELNINASLILPENYTFFKQFFAQAMEKESEKIVLKKI
ncbi:DUF3857 domain-containing protein [Psychroserpens burtonensis]|uniref:DUF3857 domain-containing protein n=1 Tax=Psychroserpens burtonensis TaxID=49278 RepID=A0A5C7B7L6_9FLAO|nr:DUF3858 domain-containing protein [Psychroserpens burtonensis]TXE17624.1 DUF3857 domain-containing protein [Psychroserpens burtonensis]